MSTSPSSYIQAPPPLAHLRPHGRFVPHLVGFYATWRIEHPILKIQKHNNHCKCKYFYRLKNPPRYEITPRSKYVLNRVICTNFYLLGNVSFSNKFELLKFYPRGKDEYECYNHVRHSNPTMTNKSEFLFCIG